MFMWSGTIHMRYVESTIEYLLGVIGLEILVSTNTTSMVD